MGSNIKFNLYKKNQEPRTAFYLKAVIVAILLSLCSSTLHAKESFEQFEARVRKESGMDKATEKAKTPAEQVTPFKEEDICSNPDISKDQRQKAEYCMATDNAKKGADTNRNLVTVWSAVTAICGTACGLEIACAFGSLGACAIYPPAGLTCTATNVGASVYDALKTKEYAALLANGMALALSHNQIGNQISGTGKLINNPYGSVPDNAITVRNNATGAEYSIEGLPGQGKPEVPEGHELLSGPPKQASAEDAIMGCLPFASSLLTTAMKMQAVEVAEDAANENLEQAKRLGSHSTSFGATATGGSALSSGSSGGRTLLSRDSAVRAQSSSACDSVSTSSSSSLKVQCAISADPSLPAFVRDPSFPANFEKYTKMNLDDFLKRGAASSDAMAGGARNAAGVTGDTSKLTAAMEKIQKDVLGGATRPNTESGAYARGGISRPQGEPDIAKQFGDLMSGLLGKIQGEEAPSREPSGVSSLDLLAKMTPAQLDQDRSISLFDRIQYRYRQSRTRLQPLPWSSRYNRSVAGFETSQ